MVYPRISVIACLSSLGEVHFALTQENTNEHIMEIFLHQLAGKLDQERPGWREQFVIFLDGAVSRVRATFLTFVFSSIVLPPERPHTAGNGNTTATHHASCPSRLQCEPDRALFLTSEGHQPQRSQIATRKIELWQHCPDCTAASAAD